MKNTIQKKIYLSHFNKEIGDYEYDSTIIKNGRFQFSGKLGEPQLFGLIMYKEKYRPAVQLNKRIETIGEKQFYLENKKITFISSDTSDKKNIFKNVEIKGSSINDQWSEWQQALKISNNKYDSLWSNFFAKSASEQNEPVYRQWFNDQANGQMDEQLMLAKKFAIAHPNYYISLVVLSNYIESTIENRLLECDSLYNLLSDNVKKTPKGIALLKFINAAKKIQQNTATDFASLTPEGKSIRLSNFKGKYILLDFWASWCGPCRQENPLTVEIYKKYKDKGLIIVSVSLDKPDGKESWVKAIKSDSLNWVNLSDLKYWNSPVASLYAIKSIPQNFLISPDFKIIEKNIHGQQLEMKLASIFDTTQDIPDSNTSFAVSITPINSTGDSTITITLDLNQPFCSDEIQGFPKIKPSTPVVLMHSGVGITENINDSKSTWAYNVEYTGKGGDGTAPVMSPIKDQPGKWIIKINPRQYFGVPKSEKIYRMNMVFNAGYWSLGEAKRKIVNPTTGSTECVDFTFEFPITSNLKNNVR